MLEFCCGGIALGMLAVVREAYEMRTEMVAHQINIDRELTEMCQNPVPRICISCGSAIQPCCGH